MNKSDISAMLIFASTLDGRIPYDPQAVEAWAQVLNNRIDTGWAAQFLKSHYGKADDLITPSHFNRAWSDYERYKVINHSGEKNDGHCGKAGCRCVHTGQCYRGWVDSQTEGMTAPCPICRQELYDTLSTLPAPGKRGDADQSRIQNRFKGVNA